MCRRQPQLISRSLAGSYSSWVLPWLGENFWRLWPDDNQWYTADMTQSVGVGHFGLVPLVVVWPPPPDRLAPAWQNPAAVAASQRMSTNIL